MNIDMEFVDKVYSFCKTLVNSKKLFNTIKEQDMTLFSSQYFKTSLLKFYRDTLIENEWMNWEEFKTFTYHNNEELSNEIENANKLVMDDNIPIFDLNVKLFIEECCVYRRSLHVRDIQNKISIFRDNTSGSEIEIQNFIHTIGQDLGMLGGIGKSSKQNQSINVLDFNNIDKTIKENYRANKDGKSFSLGVFDDKLTIKRGSLVTCQAVPKQGKSTLMRALTIINGSRGLNGILISTEMKPESNNELWNCMITGEVSDDVRTGDIMEDVARYELFKKNATDYVKKHFNNCYLEFDGTDCTLNDVKYKILKHKKILEDQGKKLDYVILDHILDLQIPNSQNQTVMYTNICTEIHNMCKEHDLIIVTPQHLKREALVIKGGKVSVKPESGFGTSALEKISEVVFYLYSSDMQKLTNEVTIEIGYSRYSEAHIKCVVGTDLQHQRFFATEPRYLGKIG